MRLTISRRTGLITAGSLTVTLTLMLVFLLNSVESNQNNKIKEDVSDISETIMQSVIFSMDQGVTDIHPFVARAEKIQNVIELRITPTNAINAGSEDLMDSIEKEVAASDGAKFFEESFNKQKVFRDIKPILAEKSCLTCHEVKENDPLAVISLRYSVEKDYAALADQRLVAIGIAAGSILASFFVLMIFLKRQVIKDLLLSVNSIKKLSAGDVSDIEEIKRNDELGTLSHSIKVLQQSMKGQSEAVNEIAKGNLSSKIILLSEEDALGKSLITVQKSISSLISDINSMSRAAKDGDLHKRVNEEIHFGDYRKIVKGCNETLDAFTVPINASSKVLLKMAEGDFTGRLEGAYKGDFSSIKESVNKVADYMTEALLNIMEAIEAAANSSMQISSSIQEMASGTEEQETQTSDVAAAVEQMTRTILETSKNAGTASANAKKAKDIAADGGKDVETTVEGMKRIAEVVSTTSETVKQLGKRSNQIGEIIEVIDDIADQTNLLALNAAIEAARAGESGRGFAVVADEVRKLAERTTKATKEIAEMIKHIQKETALAVDSIDKGTNEVESGRVMANKAGKTLNEIIGASNKVLDEVSQVASASEEQSATAEQISKNIEGINNISKESSEGIRQVALSAEKLNELTENLKKLVMKFNINAQNEEHLSVRENGKLIIS